MILILPNASVPHSWKICDHQRINDNNLICQNLYGCTIEIWNIFKVGK